MLDYLIKHIKHGDLLGVSIILTRIINQGKSMELDLNDKDLQMLIAGLQQIQLHTESHKEREIAAELITYLESAVKEFYDDQTEDI